MTYNEIPDFSNADEEEALVFLLWLDCLDRIAILTLEIRHFQVNLIHALSEPVLYRPLRFEERYLWGEYVCDSWTKAKSWLSIFDDAALNNNDIEALACLWIIRYPLHDQEETTHLSEDVQCHPLKDFVAEEERKDIERQIRVRLGEIWTRGLWRQDARRYYDTLCAAQILKSHVLRDTIAVCNWGTWAFQHVLRDVKQRTPRGYSSRRRMAHLILVRSAVLRRLRDTVERLGDLQAQLERTLDLQLQEHPRPILARRREQGLYTSFLADRCFDIYTYIDHLLTRFGAGPVETRRAGRFLDTNLKPLTMHRWQHSFTSSCKLVRDEPANTSEFRCQRADIHFVNTSYWMPDRPDLQVTIAHEISHNIIQEKYGRFDAECLPSYRDKFARLI